MTMTAAYHRHDISDRAWAILEPILPGNRVKGNAPLPLTLLPDPPRKNDMLQTLNFEKPAVMNTVDRHYDALRQEIEVLVAGNGYLCATRRDLPYAPYPDMLIAFGAAAAIAATTAMSLTRWASPRTSCWKWLPPALAGVTTPSSASGTPAWACWNTGALTTPEAVFTMRPWPATGW